MQKGSWWDFFAWWRIFLHLKFVSGFSCMFWHVHWLSQPISRPGGRGVHPALQSTTDAYILQYWPARWCAQSNPALKGYQSLLGQWGPHFFARFYDVSFLFSTVFLYKTFLHWVLHWFPSMFTRFPRFSPTGFTLFFHMFTQHFYHIVMHFSATAAAILFNPEFPTFSPMLVYFHVAAFSPRGSPAFLFPHIAVWGSSSPHHCGVLVSFARIPRGRPRPLPRPPPRLFSPHLTTTHLIHNSSPSSHAQLISHNSHNSSHTPHLTDLLLGTRSTQSLLKELRHGLAPPWPRLPVAWQARYTKPPQKAAGRIGAAVAAKLPEGAARRIPVAWHVQYTEPPEGDAADWRRRGRGCGCLLRGRHSTQSLLKELRRGLAPPWPRLPVARQAQYTEPPEGVAARICAAVAGSLLRGRRNTQSFLKELRRVWSLCGRGWLLRGRRNTQSVLKELLCGRYNQSSLTTHLISLISHRSAHSTHHTTAHPTPLISHHSSHTTHLTPLISQHSSHSTPHTTHFPPVIPYHSSHTAHLSPVTSPHSSQTVHLTPLLSQHSSQIHSSHITHFTPLITHHSSHAHLTALKHTLFILHDSSQSTQTYATYLTPFISYQPHIQAQDTKLHMWGSPAGPYFLGIPPGGAAPAFVGRRASLRLIILPIIYSSHTTHLAILISQNSAPTTHLAWPAQ